ALHEGIDVADGTLEALAHQPEVVDDGFHARAELAPWWQRDFAIGGDPRAGGERIDNLLQDLQALAHLLDPDAVAVVAIAVDAQRHLEVVLLITAIRESLAHVVVDAGGAQHGTGHSRRDR